MLAEQIKRMSPAERVEAMECLWESLDRDAVDYPSPPWHEKILAERAAQMDSTTAVWLTIDELQARLMHR